MGCLKVTNNTTLSTPTLSPHYVISVTLAAPTAVQRHYLRQGADTRQPQFGLTATVHHMPRGQSYGAVSVYVTGSCLSQVSNLA